MLYVIVGPYNNITYTLQAHRTYALYLYDTTTKNVHKQRPKYYSSD